MSSNTKKMFAVSLLLFDEKTFKFTHALGYDEYETEEEATADAYLTHEERHPELSIRGIIVLEVLSEDKVLPAELDPSDGA